MYAFSTDLCYKTAKIVTIKHKFLILLYSNTSNILEGDTTFTTVKRNKIFLGYLISVIIIEILLQM